MAQKLYESLKFSDNSQQIWLLVVLPSAEFSAPIECELSVVSLADTGPYAGLSYVWGNAANRVPIRVNGSEVYITVNLASALRHIRLRSEEKILWVDALCIHQDDLEEKSGQVSMMGDIYGSAEKVIVWLGEATLSTNAAFACFGMVDEPPPELWDSGLVGEKILKQVGERVVDGVFDVFARDWFTRMWVVQEVERAQSIVFKCGQMGMWPKDISSAAYFWNDLSETKTGYERRFKETNPRTYSFLQSLVWGGIESCSLYHLVQVHCYRRCSRPEDKIYALMGLARDAGSYGVADYTKSCKEVYTEFATAVIENTSSLDIIKAAGLGLSTEGRNLALPSWVPNWTTGRSSENFFGFAPQATLGMEAQFRVEGRHSLHARGLVFDTISYVVSIPPVDSRTETSWQDVLKSCQTGKYHGGISKLQALFRVLLFNYDTDAASQFRLTAGRANFSLHLQDFLKELGSSVSGYDTVDSRPVERFLGWLGEERNGRCDAEILGPYFGVNCTMDEWGGLLRTRVHRWRTRNSCLLGTSGRDLLETDGGWMGHAHPGARKGDLTCLVFGCPVPMILREVGSHFVIVGPAYVLGIMQAEEVLGLKMKMGLLEERDSTGPEGFVHECYRR
ncbi:heterokaryon incompatibility protein (HET) domain-containing protein [Pochonia chlamydosporia 170]|uniref:Heterokaryon incompatibility protein (HET) domain-containing protein n=1 Tax=Pochonia chlamydosporia 170 TaxID=1380566 RepID=A0A179FF46_METCM|nr:heterokaryon incompatibility protein (HET) domain-containing protein [Pochonia chlamydosporia 170]OAQ64027.2 heterokaryon incompatibility protein (HET) domain-containing protein [Pochonia chlamydosporia 170]